MEHSIDMERVLRAWECCNPFNRKCNECPYEKDCYHDGISRHMVADAIALLKEQPQIVQCRDCKHWLSPGIGYKNADLGRCVHGYGLQKSDFFCADGEKEGGEVNDKARNT